MFENLTGKLSDAFNKLTKRGALKATNIDEVLSEIRVALLEADVPTT